MKSQRTTVVTVLALAAIASTSPAHAQGMRTATGQNPLERISGSDYAGNGALGRTNVAPSYSSRSGLHDIHGGQGGQGFYWSRQLGGNSLDPRTGQNQLDNRNNPFLYPYIRTPGGQLGSGTGPQAPSSTPLAATDTMGMGIGIGQAGNLQPGIASGTPAASGIYAGVNTGAYMTPNSGSYYTGGGLNSMAYPAGLPYIQNPRSYAGMGTMGNSATSGSSYNYGISSYGLASSQYNPYQSTLGGTVGAGGLGGYNGGLASAYGGYGAAASGPYGYGAGYTNVRMLIPGIAGAAVGALIGRHFGMIGLVAGGVGGFLVATFLANQARQMPFSGMSDNYNAMIDTQYGNQYSYYHGLYDFYGQQSGTNNSGPLAGVAGAVMGAMIGKFAGLPGMLIGGVVGFVGGELISHVLFPQSQYQQGYYQYDPYNNVGNFRNASLPGSLNGAVSVRPAAPVSDDSLVILQQTYQTAFKAAQDAAASGTDAQRKAADANLKTAEAAYRAAQKSASGN